MSVPGASVNVVFLDLSKFDEDAVNSFTERFANGPSSALGPVHWVVSMAQAEALDRGRHPILRSRVTAGDELWVTNPSGLDWAWLFPDEAEAEARLVGERAGSPSLFLDKTTAIPSWLAQQNRTVAVPAAGIFGVADGVPCGIGWASKENETRGAWWIPLGQALVTPLPEGPWARFSSLRVSSLPPPREVFPREKLPVSRLAERRVAAHPTLWDQKILWRPESFPGLGQDLAVDNDQTLGGIRRRSLVATMHGQTDLREGRLRAQFDRGQWQALDNLQTGQTLVHGSRLFVQWDGRERPFSMISAFSFEGDYSWGLRQTWELRHADLETPGRAIIDSCFVEDSPEFLISVTVRWPRWKTETPIEAWAPIELDLGDAPAALPWRFQERRLHHDPREFMIRGESSGVAEGTDFVVAGGNRSLAISFPQNQAPGPRRLRWIAERRWGRVRLVLRPEGGAIPGSSSLWNDVEEHFSLLIAPAEGARLPFSPTRKQALELIPPYVSTPAETIDE